MSGPPRPTDPAARELTAMSGRPLHRRYRNRAAWGADESLRFDPDGTNKFPDAYFPVQTPTVHHTAIEVGEDPAALLGDFTSAPPTEAAQDPLVRVLAILSAVCELAPWGRTDDVNPVSGSTRQVDTIAGHRDWAATQCPGHQLNPLLPELRRRVADRARTPEIRAS